MKKVILAIAILAVFLFAGSAVADMLSYSSSILWRQVNDVTVVNQYAYCAAQNGLMIIDINNRSNPVLVSQLYTQGTPMGVAVSGGLCYLAASKQGLYIIVVTDAANPQLHRQVSLPGEAQAVALSGNYAYVADGSAGLQIIDISNVLSPTLVATYDTLITNAKDVYISGNYAYVTDDYRLLHIVDITDPTAPVHASHYTAPRGSNKICVDGNYAYLASSSITNGFLILDITNLQAIAAICSVTTGGMARDVAVASNYAYIADGYRMTVINITNKTNAFVTAYLTYTGFVHTVFSDGLHYVYSANNSGLNISQVTDPASPVNIGNYEMENLSPVYETCVDGNYAYIANGDPALRIYDVSDAANPVKLADLTMAVGYHSVTETNGLVYLVGDESPRLQIIDVSSPFNATALGTFDTTGTARKVVVSGSYAYIAGASPGLQIINVSDPELPVSVGSYEMVNAIMDVQVVGTYAYVAAYDSGLYILDISDPTQPERLGKCDTYRARGLAIDGIFAYIADEGEGLRVLSVFDRTNPIEIAHNTDIACANDVYIYGNYALVAASEEGVAIFDITNPASPTLIEIFDTPGNALSLMASQGKVYVSDSYNMSILNCTASGIDDNRSMLPNSYLTITNYPNPFNAATNISFNIQKKADVQISIYDLLGRQVGVLYSGLVDAGKHTIEWQPENLGSGVYFCKISAGYQNEIHKLALLK